MKIAIIGSREFKNKELVEKTLAKELTSIIVSRYAEVITGGASGIDTWVEEFCKKNFTPCKIIRPINPAKKIDYLFRNVEIITLADKIIVFWDGKSKGTKFVIDYAKERGKDVEIIKENEN